MFSNFKDTFIRRPQFTVKTPDAVVDLISKGLPEGFRYVDDHNGFCRLVCDGEMKITPANVVPPEGAELVFAKKGEFNEQDVMQYAYNAQTKIELLPDSDGCFLVNGQKIKKEDFVVAPLKDVAFVDGHFYIVPPKFPDPFPIELSGNGYSLNVLVQRKPMNSFTTVRFSSVGESAISISYTFDLSRNGDMEFQIKTGPSQSAVEVLASKEIFNAFILGKGCICGLPVPYCEENQDKIIAKETMDFWHRLVAVEKELDAEFDATQEIDMDDIKLIDGLYRSLVEKKPYKKYLTDLKLSGIGSFDEVSARAKETPVGTEIMFEFTEDILIKILGVERQVFSIVSVFRGMISEIKLPPDGETGDFSIKLVPAEGKRMFSATQYCLEEGAVERIRSDKTHVDAFLAAEELSKY